jgi:hypothetical protein
VAANDYHFVSKWRVMAAPEEVYDVVGRAETLAQWWPAAFLSVLEIQPGDENGLNKVVRLDTKGYLPYKLRWHIGVTRVDYPNGFAFRVWGDFDGTGEWRFERDGPWTDVTFDWRVRVNKPLVRHLSAILKPVFASNHRWAMGKGEESLGLELTRRRTADPALRASLPPPPGPVKTGGLPVALGAVAILALVLLRLRR